MHLNETSKCALAKSFTELAIQNGLINQCAILLKLRKK